jgi:hypothetical protein
MDLKMETHCQLRSCNSVTSYRSSATIWGVVVLDGGGSDL